MSEWIPLMDYAVKKGVSLSTLRRHIKANKVAHRIENGRYLIQLENAANDQSMKSAPAGAIADLSAKFASQSRQEHLQPSRIAELERDLQQAREEIAEMKMLIALYEGNA